MGKLARPPSADRVLQAVRTVTERLAIRDAELEVIGAGFGGVVSLGPVPLVARVAIGTDELAYGAPAAMQLDLVAYAAARGAPVVPPASEVDPGPHAVDDLVVTLWDRVEARGPGSPAEVGAALRRFHEAVADYGGPLPSYDPRPQALRMAEVLDGLDDAARRDAATLRAAAGECRLPDLPVQALHGDAHIWNTVGTNAGVLLIDFDGVRRGPVEWDLASVAHRAVVFGDFVFETNVVLDAYGPTGREQASTLTDLVALHLATATARSMLDRSALRPLLDQRLAWLHDRLAL